MDRDFRTGRIEIDFPAEPFASAPTLLARSAVVFFSNLQFLAAITLVVYLPAKLAIQFASYVLDVPTSGILSYIFLEVSDLVLGALAVPAVIYGLVERFRGRRAPMAECLRWGRRAWARMLWNQFKVDITITLWGALLIVPGILAMVRLIFVEPVVAIEGDSAADPLERSRGLTRGRRWRIFFVIAPLAIGELVGSFLALHWLEDAMRSRALLAVGDSLLSVGGQWTTVAALLMYLGTVERQAQVGDKARKTTAPKRRR
jgi:hypothetical protein